MIDNIFQLVRQAHYKSIFNCMKTLDLSKSVYELTQGVPVWMDKGGRTMLVTYLAVRDADRTYLGTVELVQDMEFAKEHFIKI